MRAPVEHLSYAAINQFLSNPLAFKKQYILKQFDIQYSPSAVVGKGCHIAVDVYLNGSSHDEAIKAGSQYMTGLSDFEIDFGKTGSREKINRNFTQAIDFYFKEFEEPYEILGVEEPITAECINISGEKFAIPFKGKLDLVSKNKVGEIEITDHKFTSRYTDAAILDPIKVLQAVMYYYLVKERYGEYPARMIFNECKISKNKNGDPQIQPYIIEFKNIQQQLAVFNTIINGVIKKIIDPNYEYLPNISDIFNGQDAYDAFSAGVIGVEQVIEVQHKTELTKFSEKNFIPSTANKIANKKLGPEHKIVAKLQEFAMPVQHRETYKGANVTMHAFEPSRGVAMSKIGKTSHDLELALGVDGVRVVAPLPNTTMVGVEVPNPKRKVIEFGDNHLNKSTLKFPIGVNVYGETIYGDLTKMPHLLIAGSTGSGKSVMLNVLLESLIRQNTNKELQLALIDPKQVELAAFSNRGYSHPAATDIATAELYLSGALEEMEKRYKKLQKLGIRSIDEYKGKAMPRVVIVIDEFADLIMQSDMGETNSVDWKQITSQLNNIAAMKLIAGKKITQKDLKELLKGTEQGDIQKMIIMLAQKARAVGIHLVIATQRPSADVVNGLIKANFPHKISFMTTTGVNSKVILDETGAEKLMGKGDMLYQDPGAKGLQRLQGLFA